MFFNSMLQIPVNRYEDVYTRIRVIFPAIMGGFLFCLGFFESEVGTEKYILLLYYET